MVAACGGRCVIAVAPEVGGEAAAGLTFSLALAAALSWAISWGLLLGWENTFGPMLVGLANALKIDVWRVHLDPAGALRDIDHHVRSALQASIASADTAIGFWFHQTARLQGWIADETWKIARDTAHFGEWMVHTYVPTYVHGLTDVLHGVTHTTTKVVHRTETRVVHLTKTVYVTVKGAAAVTVPRVAIPHVAEWQWIHRHWKALTKAVAAAGAAVAFPPLALPRLFPRIGRLEREAANEAKRLHRAEAWIGATALAAAMANVLGLRSARCLRSGNLGRISRAICGLDSGLFSSLLGLLTAIVAPFSIVALAEANQKLLPGVIDGLGYLIEEAPAELYAVADDVLAEAASLLPGI